MQRILPAAVLVAGSLLAAPAARAHCQVPCGIFDDHARVQQLREDVATILKSVRELAALNAKGDIQSRQQVVRWVMTKEAHAEKIIRTIADYFLAQKIPPVAAKDKRGHAAYLERLARHHAVLVAAMKCKQSAAMEPVTALGKTIDAIDKYWPAK